MTDKTIDLDQHRGMAAQKTTDLRRLLADVEANERSLRLRQDELESHLIAADNGDPMLAQANTEGERHAACSGEGHQSQEPARACRRNRGDCDATFGRDLAQGSESYGGDRRGGAGRAPVLWRGRQGLGELLARYQDHGK